MSRCKRNLNALEGVNHKLLLNDIISDANQSIIDYYGLINQLDQLMEECGELIAACNHYKRALIGNDKRMQFLREENLKSEIADVVVVLDQILERKDVTSEVLNFMAESKINRQLARIKNGGK